MQQGTMELQHEADEQHVVTLSSSGTIPRITADEPLLGETSFRCSISGAVFRHMFYS